MSKCQIQIDEEKQRLAKLALEDKDLDKIPNLWMQRCIEYCLRDILREMVIYMDIPKILQRLMWYYRNDTFDNVSSNFKKMLAQFKYVPSTF